MENLAMHRVPTLRERFWRALGFRYHLGDDPEGIDGLNGWMRIDIKLNFSFADWLRLLVSGNLFIALVSHTDTESPTVIRNRLYWQIRAPGAKE